MGTVFKPIVTKPLPAGAVVTERDGERTARWRTAQGGLRTAAVRTTPRGDCVVIESGKYLARFKDGQGITQTIPTGCRDEMAARSVLTGLERRAELVRAGVLTSAEDAVSEHKRTTITGHVEAYLAALKARRTSLAHQKAQRRLLGAVIAGCRFKTLADIKREPVERWLATSKVAARSARTRNTYGSSIKWFCNWCVDTERLVASPVARLARADERVDRRRLPRAFTLDELVRLLDAAHRRPLEEALKFNKGWRKGQPGARIRPETRAKLEALGRERALIYKTLILTGLRLGELTSMRVCDAMLDGPAPHLMLDAKHEKNRQGSTVPVRADLRDDLASWIAERSGERTSLLFDIPQNLVKVFNRDLRFAGIAKHDDRGKTACVHSFRHTFGTLMNAGGVAPRVAQAAMRHSTMDLTMSVYTDPRLLDVAAALSILPDLRLPGHPEATAGASARVPRFRA